MVKKLFNTIVVLIIAAILIAVGFLAVPLVRGDKIYAVLTESMEPTYPVGSLVVVEKVQPQEVNVNDVITFDAGSGFKTVATHRVIEKHPESSEFITKGDNNNANDLAPIKYSAVVGRVRYGLPYLGTIVTKLKTSEGIIAATAVLIVVILLLTIPELFKKNEVSKKRVSE